MVSETAAQVAAVGTDATMAVVNLHEVRAARAAAKSEDKPKHELLADIIESQSRIVRAPTGRAYAVRHDGKAIACDGEDAVEWLSSELWRLHRKPTTRGMVGDVLRGHLGSNIPTCPIPIRVAGNDRKIAFDLGARVLEIDANGVHAASGPVTFARPKGTGPLPDPILPKDDHDAACVFDALRSVLGVEKETWPIVVAWLFATLRPIGPYPVLLVRGEQGSGKSTLSRLIRAIVDPRDPNLRRLPQGDSSSRDLAIAAEHCHALVFDNASAIDVTTSDTLCRLATGDGFTTRALYSDRDEAVFVACRPMLLNSIADAATRPDLLSRSLVLDVPPRLAVRRTEEEIHQDFYGFLPRVLGALLRGVSRALQGGEVTIDPSIRMVGAARFASLAAPAVGLSAVDIERAYLSSGDAAAIVAEDDPVLRAVVGFMQEERQKSLGWRGTMGDLLDSLDSKRSDFKRPMGWPESPRGLGASIARLAPALRREGIEHERPNSRTGHEKTRAHVLRWTTNA